MLPDALADPSLYINRELSWVEFNARVLHEALDSRTPLLERLKFISIFSTNLDEFYMVRVAGLRRQVAASVTSVTPDGRTPHEQLDAIGTRVGELLKQQLACLHTELLPALSERGIVLLGMADLADDERATVDQFFEAEVFPILTPLAVDPGHPFPYISNLSLSLAVELHDARTGRDRFASVKVPKSLPRWVRVSDAPRYVPLECLIGANLGILFPGHEIRSWNTFRITRNSDIDLAPSEEPEDLLAAIEEHVFLRRFGEVVRVEVETKMAPRVRSLLVEELRDDRFPPNSRLSERDVQDAGTCLGLGDLIEIATLDLPELRDPPFIPITPQEFRQERRSVFDVIRERDVLLHHPFDSFDTTVEEFLEEAAADPRVLAIKLTLYRTSGDTAVVRALAEAAERGKQVVVVVELKARFDETNNINWARTLESHGVHAVYGSVSLKTHAKVALVVRRDPDGIRRYAHIGTGNYNTRTARLYTDIGLLTCNPSIGADLSTLFNYLTGFSIDPPYEKLLVAPRALREQVIGLITREAENAAAGRPARIIAKMNAIVDPETIRALYQASMAGVDIDLIVRGICCLRPGIPGVSDRIRVVSIIGRFLEHSRLWYFANGGAEEYYTGSADWMPRNFERRVEAVTPIADAQLFPRLGSMLETYLTDNRNAWDLEADGNYIRRIQRTATNKSAQLEFMAQAWEAAARDERWLRLSQGDGDAVADVADAETPPSDAELETEAAPSPRRKGRSRGAKTRDRTSVAHGDHPVRRRVRELDADPGAEPVHQDEEPLVRRATDRAPGSPGPRGQNGRG